MKNILRVLIITGIIAVPISAFAQNMNITGGLTNLSGIVTTFNNTIVRSVATLFASLAMVAFFYGIVQFIWGSREGKPDVMTNGKNFMLWGLIALFVMFSVWGIVRYFQNVFGVQGNTITIPSLQSGATGGVLQTGSNPFSSPVSPTQTNPFGTSNTQTSPFQTSGDSPIQVQSNTTAGYGSGTAACTPPQVQSPEGGCYTP